MRRAVLNNEEPKLEIQYFNIRESQEEYPSQGMALTPCMECEWTLL